MENDVDTGTAGAPTALGTTDNNQTIVDHSVDTNNANGGDNNNTTDNNKDMDHVDNNNGGRNSVDTNNTNGGDNTNNRGDETTDTNTIMDNNGHSMHTNNTNGGDNNNDRGDNNGEDMDHEDKDMGNNNGASGGDTVSVHKENEIMATMDSHSGGARDSAGDTVMTDNSGVGGVPVPTESGVVVMEGTGSNETVDDNKNDANTGTVDNENDQVLTLMSIPRRTV